jgi:probable rRNA maturation factor
VNDKLIKEINLNYLAENRPTDCITFDITSSEDKENIFADIVISTDTAISNSKIFKTTPLNEIYLYVIHSVLHLLGYDDKTKKQKRIMENKTDVILRSVIASV